MVKHLLDGVALGRVFNKHLADKVLGGVADALPCGVVEIRRVVN